MVIKVQGKKLTAWLCLQDIKLMGNPDTISFAVNKRNQPVPLPWWKLQPTVSEVSYL